MYDFTLDVVVQLHNCCCIVSMNCLLHFLAFFYQYKIDCDIQYGVVLHQCQYFCDVYAHECSNIKLTCYIVACRFMHVMVASQGPFFWLVCKSASKSSSTILTGQAESHHTGQADF